MGLSSFVRSTSKFSISFGAVLITCLLSSCKPDDQTSIKPEHFLYANPTPVSRDGAPERFFENNRQHKILVGVFDTGIDYNHPYIRDHVHFDLDPAGAPVGAGLDFLTDGDRWASHRAISTSLYDYEFLSERQKKDAIDSYKAPEEWDKNIRRTKMGGVCAINYLIKLDKRLEQYIQPYRDISFERYNSQHGTHVSGLITYDRPEIGIIPYRVLPYHETVADEADAARGKADKFVSNFEKALEHARANGVKIINLSLGGSFTKPTDTNNSSYEAEKEKFENYKRLLTGGLETLVSKYSEMLFVAAAGNDSGWSDNESRLQYPCGLEAPNVLCVGALNKDGTLAQFTNLPVNHVDLVMASGVKVISTIPADSCEYLSKQLSSFLTGGSNHTGLCRYDINEKKWNEAPAFAEKFKSLISTFYEQCSPEKELFTEMSGSSMATPIVSRIAAITWLEHPGFNPKEVIEAIKGSATADTKRKLVTYKLKAETPSWYKLFYDKKGTDGDVPSIDQNFISPPQVAGPGEKTIAKRVAKHPFQGWFEFAVTAGREAVQAASKGRN